jgi:hypothetical protein
MVVVVLNADLAGLREFMGISVEFVGNFENLCEIE